MKNRISALVLAALLTFSGCGGDSEQSPEPVATPEAVSTPIPTAAPTPEPIKVPEGRLLITIHTELGEVLSEDGQSTLLTYVCQTPALSGVNAETVNGILREQWTEYFDTTLADMETTARENYAWNQTEGIEWVPYELRRSVSVARGDETIVSFLLDDYTYAGGVHGYSARTALTFRSDGSQIRLEDLSADPVALRKFCVEQMKVQSRSAEFAQYSFFYDYEQTLPLLVENNTWYLSDKGLVIVANPYDIAPYAFGRIEFTIPYAALEGQVYDWVLPEMEMPTGTLWGALGMEETGNVLAVVDDETDGQGQPIRFTADGQVRNVWLQRVAYNDYTGGFDVQESLWYATSMESGEVLQLLTWIPDTMPNLKISYQGKDGRVQAWYISQSGLDGALILLDAADFTTLPRNITEEVPFRHDLDNDGVMEIVDIQSYTSDLMGDTALRIAITESDGTVHTADTNACWDQRLWLADGDGDGRAEIYFSGDIASDDYMLCAWRYDGTALQPMEFRDETTSGTWLPGQIDAVDGSGGFTLRSTRYMLGTYSAQRPFAIDANGVFAPVEGSYWQFDSNSFWLELLCDLPAKQGEESVTLPAGSHLLLHATDGVSWAEFLTEEYNAVRVPVQRWDGLWVLSGVKENQAFGVLPYAG